MKRSNHAPKKTGLLEVAQKERSHLRSKAVIKKARKVIGEASDGGDNWIENIIQSVGDALLFIFNRGARASVRRAEQAIAIGHLLNLTKNAIGRLDPKNCSGVDWPTTMAKLSGGLKPTACRERMRLARYKTFRGLTVLGFSNLRELMNLIPEYKRGSAYKVIKKAGLWPEGNPKVANDPDLFNKIRQALVEEGVIESPSDNTSKGDKPKDRAERAYAGFMAKINAIDDDSVRKKFVAAKIEELKKYHAKIKVKTVKLPRKSKKKVLRSAANM